MDRATATAAEIADDELRAAAPALVAKVTRLRPTAVAFLGLTAYRVAFGGLRAAVGPQPEPMGSSRVWLLPNCSGLNALPVAGPSASTAPCAPASARTGEARPADQEWSLR